MEAPNCRIQADDLDGCLTSEVIELFAHAVLTNDNVMVMNTCFLNSLETSNIRTLLRRWPPLNWKNKKIMMIGNPS